MKLLRFADLMHVRYSPAWLSRLWQRMEADGLVESGRSIPMPAGDRGVTAQRGTSKPVPSRARL